MSYPKIPLAQQVIQLCAAKGIHHVVISPGSRSAPLTIGFSAYEKIKTYSVVDERCAAFFAMGMAQGIKQPVAVVCTSGSALLNYYPAIAEAYYSKVPLIIISADRPKHLIDVGDGQTIRQENVFANHILYSANLNEGLDDNDENQKQINAAINIAVSKHGPVHINVPFSEPLYETYENFTEEINVIDPRVEPHMIDAESFSVFLKEWKGTRKRMVLIGVNSPNEIEQHFLDFLGKDEATIVFTESTSNVHHANFFPSIDKIIAPLNEQEFGELQPEILLTFGGVFVSKKIKAFLRNYTPKAHYHVGIENVLNTFFCLKDHFNVSEKMFFKELTAHNLAIKSDYQSKWLTIKEQRAIKHKAYLEALPFSDFKAFEYILKMLPNDIVLHLSNSSTIRYVQLFDENPNVVQYCNRGTSGIDGTTSTAIGHAVVSNKQNVLITGDLSFLYDSNGLWNTNIPTSFRIIIVNNNGGGIFRILPGAKNTTDFETYFETTHQLSAEHLSKMYGFEYTAVKDEVDLKTKLKDFYTTSTSPKILEIFTPRTVNDLHLIGYFKHLRS